MARHSIIMCLTNTCKRSYSLFPNNIVYRQCRNILHTIVQSRGTRDHSQAQDDALFTKSFSVLASTTLWSKIQDIYDLNNRETWTILRSPHALIVNDNEIIKTVEYLKENNIPREQLLRVPWVAYLNKNELESKSSLLLKGEHMFASLTDGLGMCRLSDGHINFYSKIFFNERSLLPENCRNKIYYIGKELSVPVPEMTEAIVCAHRVLKLPFTNIQSLVELLLRYDVDRDAILSDPWLFHSNSIKAEQRFTTACHNSSSTPKPWIFRCTDEIFDKYMSRQKALQQDKEIIEPYGGSKEAMVCDMLGCDSNELSVYLTDCHPLYSKSPRKIKAVIDLLLAEGYAPAEIMRHLRLVAVSVNTLKSRIAILKECGCFHDSIRLLGSASKHFNSFLGKIKNEYPASRRNESKTLSG